MLEEPDPPDALKIVIFRIIQEALNNVAKHSGANSVTLRLAQENGAIGMTIRDNGKGFDVAEARESARISSSASPTGCCRAPTISPRIPRFI